MKHLEELEIGVVYRMLSPNDRQTYVIMRESNSLSYTICLQDGDFERNISWGPRPWEIAGAEEEAWLKACIEAGRFVLKPKITSAYSIY